MTTAHDYLHPPAGGWTVDDLDTLPEDNYRRELIDGVLHVSPSPTHDHQKVALRLGAALDASCPEEYDVTQAVEIRINRFRSLIPDLLVVTAEAAVRNPSTYRPREVVLAVEIVSPSSKAMDRATKPAMYAEAGIPHYWRIETEASLVVHTYRLDPARDAYDLVANHADLLVVADPWPMELRLSAMTSRPR